MSVLSSVLTPVLQPVLGSVFDASAGQSAAIGPEQFFANGEKGAWFDISDLSSLFQDSSGTVPVTGVGQPVARINDKSGNGNHAIAQSAATSLALDAGGRYCLQAAASAYQTPSIDLSVFTEVAHISAVLKTSDAAASIVLEFSSNASSNAGAFSTLAPSSTSGQNYGVRSRGSLSVTASVTGLAAPNTNVVGGISSISDRTIYAYVDGVLRVLDTTNQGTGSYGNWVLNMLRRAGGTLAFSGNFYGAMFRAGPIKTEDYNRLSRYFSGLAGVESSEIPQDYAGWGSSSMSGIGPFVGSYMPANAASKGSRYYNGGKSGERGEHTLARLGSRPALIAPVGGSIPASGSVLVTSSNMPASAALMPFEGDISGVVGTISSSNTEITFTRKNSGSAVPVVGEQPFYPTIGLQRRRNSTLLWAGKNSLTGGVSADDVAAQVLQAYDWLNSDRRAIVGFFVDGGTPAVSALRDRIILCNTILQAAHPSKYIDIQGWCTSQQAWIDTGITPTQADLDEQVIGNKPPSLSVDNGHFTAAVNSVIVNKVIAPRLQEMGW